MPQNTTSRNPNAQQGRIGGQEGHGWSQNQGQGREAVEGQQQACAMNGGLHSLLGGSRDVNVGDVERVVSVMGGGVLTLFAASRGGLTGLGLAILGGGLIYRGVTGHCEAYHGLGVDTTDAGREPAAQARGARI
jgi:hypothetical protein